MILDVARNSYKTHTDRQTSKVISGWLNNEYHLHGVFNASVTYDDVATARFCGLQFVDGIFANCIVLETVEEMITNLTGSTQQL